MGASSPCPGCGASVLDIDVRCPECGHALGSTGAQRMLGKLVLGQYELIEVLGQGGMSVVYKGRHRITEQPVALKILPPELAAHSQLKARFFEEARALAQLDHPNIVHLYNFGEENGSFVLAMQLVAGKTWERLIFENKRLSWQVTAGIAVDVLRALEYAHGRGVVHRDMKASNVLVRAADGAATVMDFGIAKMTTSSRLTATGQTMGTVRYMSPEQVRGQDVDSATDLYSLGATIYESLTGETPFDGATHFDIMSKHLSEAPKPLAHHRVEVPRAFEEAVLRCLAKVPGDRFNSARELRKTIEAVLREHDAGLVETQKLSRDLLVDPPLGSGITIPPGTLEQHAPRSAPGTGAAPRPTTAVPAEAPPPPRRGLFVAAIGLLVALAAAATAAVLLLRTEAPAPWRPEGVAFVDEAAFPELGLERVRTTAAVAPARIAEAFSRAREAIAGHLRGKGMESPAPPVRSIVVVPKAVMCERSTYQGVSVAEMCNTAATFRSRDRMLVLVETPERLDDAMRTGLAEAVCVALHDAVKADRREAAKTACAEATVFSTSEEPSKEQP